MFENALKNQKGAKKRARRTEPAYYNAAQGRRQIFLTKNAEKENAPTLRG
jgi:hypothetical protein